MRGRIHRRNQQLMQAVSVMEDLRSSSVMPYFATILVTRKVST